MFSKEEIVYIAPDFFPLRKANSLHVINQVAALAKQCGSVELIYKSHKGAFYSEFPPNVIQKPIIIERNTLFSNIFFWKGIFKIRKNLFRKKIITRSRISLLLGLILPLKGSLIFEAHEPIKSVLFRFIICLFKIKLIVISEALKIIILKELKCQDSEIIVLHDGACLINEIKTPTKKSVTYIGSIGKGRGIELIAEIALMLPHIDFNIIGKIGDNIFSKQIDNLLFHGWLDQEDIRSIALTSSVFIAPYQLNLELDNGLNTLSYMSPLKIFEYMSYNRPIVVSDLPVIREVLTDGVDCLMVKNLSDPQEWADCIVKLVDSEEFSLKLAKNANDNLGTNYTWDIRATKILEFLVR